jgi:hypothetical protein
MGPPKSYAFDFKGKNYRKNIFVVSQAIGIIRSIAALRSGRRRVRSPSAKYRHRTIPIRKRAAMTSLNLHFAGCGHVSSRAHELGIMNIHRDSAVEPKGRADCVHGQPNVRCAPNSESDPNPPPE